MCFEWTGLWQVESFRSLDSQSQYRRQNFGTGAYEKHSFLSNLPIFRHLNSICCKHSAVGINVIIYYRRRTTTKTEVFPSVRIFQRTLELALLNIPFFQNANSWSLMNTIIHSILTLFQVANIGINIIIQASIQFSNFDYSKAYMYDLQMLHVWNLEFRVISLICNH